MFNQKGKLIFYFFLTIVLVFGLSISLQSVLAQWVAPTLSPPNGNVPPPVHTGWNPQVKLGNFTVGSNFFVLGDMSADLDTLWVDSAVHRVGVGTNNPADKLEVYGDLRINTSAGDDDQIFFTDNGEISSLDSHHRILFRRSSNIFEVREHGDIFFSPGATSGQETAKMVIKSNGRVGIGTKNPQSTLHVRGDVRVQNGSFIDDGVNLNVPDYVFTDDYDLLPIGELGKYIKVNKHLPDLPDESDVAGWADLSLQDRDMLILKKLEELYLYTIKQDKKINDLQEENQALRVLLK